MSKRRYRNAHWLQNMGLCVVSVLVVALMTVVIACAKEEAPSEPEIPAHYSTYTSEGLFSISYPPEWEPTTSVMEELFELAKEWVQSLDPEAQLEGEQMLFIGGLPTEEGWWWPNVNIAVAPRSVGYWELDEIVEVESQWNRELFQGYREFFRVETVIDAREAIIIESQVYDRYLQAYIVKGKHVWIVSCTADAEGFKDYEDTFYSVVRSLRILK